MAPDAHVCFQGIYCQRFPRTGFGKTNSSKKLDPVALFWETGKVPTRCLKMMAMSKTCTELQGLDLQRYRHLFHPHRAQEGKFGHVSELRCYNSSW